SADRGDRPRRGRNADGPDRGLGRLGRGAVLRAGDRGPGLDGRCSGQARGPRLSSRAPRHRSGAMSRRATLQGNLAKSRSTLAMDCQICDRRSVTGAGTTATASQLFEPDETTADREPLADDRWWREAVVYQVYVRSFADANGDGIGDLAGVRDRLPYLRDLGVDALWFNPWYPSPLADWGYDIADYRSIDPAFGTLEDARSEERR